MNALDRSTFFHYIPSLSRYRRMNSDIANTPGGVDIGSIFGEEDTVPLSTIAEDMTMLVTSSRNGKNAVGNSNFNENAGTYGGGTSTVNTGHVLNNGSQSNISRNNQDGRHFTDSDNFSCIQGNSALAGLPISQMNSFDTMASRVSAPNLVSLHEMALRKAGNCNCNSCPDSSLKSSAHPSTFNSSFTWCHATPGNHICCNPPSFPPLSIPLDPSPHRRTQRRSIGRCE